MQWYGAQKHNLIFSTLICTIWESPVQCLRTRQPLNQARTKIVQTTSEWHQAPPLEYPTACGSDTGIPQHTCAITPNVPALPGSDTNMSGSCSHHFWVTWVCPGWQLMPPRCGTSMWGGLKHLNLSWQKLSKCLGAMQFASLGLQIPKLGKVWLEL